MNVVERTQSSMARNVRRLGHLDLPGAGQVCVAGKHAYVGHIPNKDHLGTSIVDISDPANPRVVATITLDDPASHSHKARVVGDIMIVNSERNPTAIGRRADELPRVMQGTDRRQGPRADARGDRDLARRRAEPTSRRSRRRRSAAITTAASRSTTSPTARSRRRSRTTRPAASACTASTWTRTTPTSRPRWRATSATSWSSTTSAIRRSRRKSRAGGCRGSTSRAARSRPGRAASTGCITRCASATSCGRAAGTAACASSTSPTSASRRPSAPTTITRRSRSRRTRSCRCRD